MLRRFFGSTPSRSLIRHESGYKITHRPTLDSWLPRSQYAISEDSNQFQRVKNIKLFNTPSFTILAKANCIDFPQMENMSFNQLCWELYARRQSLKKVRHKNILKNKKYRIRHMKQFKQVTRQLSLENELIQTEMLRRDEGITFSFQVADIKYQANHFHQQHGIPQIYQNKEELQQQQQEELQEE